MKALMLTAYNEFEFMDVPVPEIGADDVLVQVKACGICGSDIHGMDGSSGRRIPPLIMGHEAAGVISQVGANVTQWQVGDRVTFDSMISCGNCYFCRRGEPNLCDDRRVLGVSPGDYRQHGAFAEYVALPQRILFPLPDQLSFEHASMAEPVSIASHAVNITPLALGDSAVVIGAGMIGNLVIQALRLAGCGQIIAVDLDASKLEVAREVGATHTLVVNQCDVPEEVRKLTGGRGADMAFEAVGISAAVKSAVDSVRKGGSVTLVGNLAAKIDFPLQSVVTREITLYGSCGINGEYPATLELIASGKINVDALITNVAPLNEGGDWFHRLYDQEPGLMKVILKP
ncbi:MAG: galactitol-1-phosphate 5-dehydrogenase [Caldilineaceae bacterium]|nr:galactitol-1-phosphate 5-dehydrogenase [Caldilineaceae bacterium]